jgi:hypothetical protein
VSPPPPPLYRSPASCVRVLCVACALRVWVVAAATRSLQRGQHSGPGVGGGGAEPPPPSRRGIRSVALPPCVAPALCVCAVGLASPPLPSPSVPLRLPRFVSVSASASGLHNGHGAEGTGAQPPPHATQTGREGERTNDTACNRTRLHLHTRAAKRNKQKEDRRQKKKHRVMTPRATTPIVRCCCSRLLLLLLPSTSPRS